MASGQRKNALRLLEYGKFFARMLYIERDDTGGFSHTPALKNWEKYKNDCQNARILFRA